VIRMSCMPAKGRIRFEIRSNPAKIKIELEC
jgi:hypothetical protein